MRKLLTLIIILLALVVATGSTVAYAAYADHMASYVTIPKAPGPYPAARNMVLKFDYNVTVLGNVSLSKRCIDLTHVVEECPGYHSLMARMIANIFDVKLCTIISRPRALVFEGSRMIELQSKGASLSLSNVGGRTLRVLYLGGAGTYITINVLLIVRPFFIFEGYTYITLSEAYTYYDRARGLLEGYTYATAAFPQEIVNLVFALVNRYLPYDWWGYTARVLTLLLDFFDYVAIAAATGLKSKTVSAACLGSICVICRTSWNAIQGLIHIAKAVFWPSSIIEKLYEKAPNCVIVNKTSGMKLNVHQKAKLIVYIYEQYGWAARSYRISLIIPSCNSYFCIIKFEEKYPVKVLNLAYVKPPKIVALYSILSEGQPFIINVPRYNATLYVEETAHVSYTYTHVVSVSSYAEVPLLTVTSSNIKLEKQKEPLIVTLSAPARLALSKSTKTYYIYYVNGPITIKVPLEKEIEKTIPYYGEELKVRYKCSLSRVLNGKIVEKTRKFAIIRVDAYRDTSLTVIYNCEPVSPVPYLRSITCKYVNPSEAVVNLQMENLGGSGAVSLQFKSNEETVNKLINLTTGGVIITNATISAEPGEVISVMYNGITIGACQVPKPVTTGTKILAIIPVSEYMNESKILNLIKNNISKLSEIKKNIGYISGEKITKIIIVVKGSNANVKEVKIGNVTATCKKKATMSGASIFVCTLSRPIPSTSYPGAGKATIYTNKGSEEEKISTTVNEPNETIKSIDVITNWYSVNMLNITLIMNVTNALLYRSITVGVIVPGGIEKYVNISVSRTSIEKSILVTVYPSELSQARYIKIVIMEGTTMLNSTKINVYNFTYCYVMKLCKLYENETLPGGSTLTLPVDCINVICLPTYSKKVIIISAG
ncbi:MAG: hypothetical protein GXO26_09130 [Crenarchaeota archaeon]|nr:hypothetical protein [Thermoproteota archaeon]